MKKVIKVHTPVSVETIRKLQLAGYLPIIVSKYYAK